MEGTKFVWKNYEWECRMAGGAQINAGNPWQYYSEKQVKIINDLSDWLLLSAAKEPKEIHHWKGQIYHPDYATGTVRSTGTFGYGLFEATIKFPKGCNLWPSFWLCGDEVWPQSGEIDVAECYSGRSNYSRLFSWRTTTNIHWFDEKHLCIGAMNMSKCLQPLNPAEQFIKYSVRWLPNKITISANDVVVREDIISALNILKFWREDIGEKPRMRVIFNVWVENPKNCRDKIEMITPMVVKDFKYMEIC